MISIAPMQRQGLSPLGRRTLEKVLRVGRTIGYPLAWCLARRDVMLRSMRHNIKYLSITLWLVIASFIATIFLVWGMQSAGPGSGRDVAVAATVNGERISRLEFQRAYERALDGLTPPRLLLQEAERHGLSVSREELAAVVMENPLFAEEGKFRPERYRRLLEESDRK